MFLGLDVSVLGPSGARFRCLCEGVWFLRLARAKKFQLTYPNKRAPILTFQTHLRCVVAHEPFSEIRNTFLRISYFKIALSSRFRNTNFRYFVFQIFGFGRGSPKFQNMGVQQAGVETVDIL